MTPKYFRVLVSFSTLHCLLGDRNGFQPVKGCCSRRLWFSVQNAQNGAYWVVLDKRLNSLTLTEALLDYLSYDLVAVDDASIVWLQLRI